MITYFMLCMALDKYPVILIIITCGASELKWADCTFSRFRTHKTECQACVCFYKDPQMIMICDNEMLVQVENKWDHLAIVLKSPVGGGRIAVLI